MTNVVRIQIHTFAPLYGTFVLVGLGVFNIRGRDNVNDAEIHFLLLDREMSNLGGLLVLLLGL